VGGELVFFPLTKIATKSLKHFQILVSDMVHGDRSPPRSETDASDSLDAKPQPPVDAPTYAVDPLAAQSPGLLREIGQYVLALADWKAAQQSPTDEEDGEDPYETPDEWDDDAWDEELEAAYAEAELPEGVGGIYVNHIDGRGYYYLKGSHNGEFFSQYVAPVEPKERGGSD